MQLHGWFKPRFRFTVDGQPWLTDGRVALAVSPDAVPADLDDHAQAHRMVDTVVSIALPSPLTRKRTENGYAFLGEVREEHYQAHMLDLCEAAHPGMTWRMTNELDAPNLVGFHGATVVAVVAGMRGEPIEPAFANCPECSGLGGPQCKTCDGTGETTCPHCEHETECDECDGDGYTDNCAACDGTGKWKPPQNEGA